MFLNIQLAVIAYSRNFDTFSIIDKLSILKT